MPSNQQFYQDVDENSNKRHHHEEHPHHWHVHDYYYHEQSPHPTAFDGHLIKPSEHGFAEHRGLFPDPKGRHFYEKDEHHEFGVVSHD